MMHVASALGPNTGKAAPELYLRGLERLDFLMGQLHVRQPNRGDLAGCRVSVGVTVLRVKIDLSRQKPGNFFIGLRQALSDWTFYPVSIM